MRRGQAIRRERAIGRVGKAEGGGGGGVFVVLLGERGVGWVVEEMVRGVGVGGEVAGSRGIACRRGRKGKGKGKRMSSFANELIN